MGPASLPIAQWNIGKRVKGWAKTSIFEHFLQQHTPDIVLLQEIPKEFEPPSGYDLISSHPHIIHTGILVLRERHSNKFSYVPSPKFTSHDQDLETASIRVKFRTHTPELTLISYYRRTDISAEVHGISLALAGAKRRATSRSTGANLSLVIFCDCLTALRMARMTKFAADGDSPEQVEWIHNLIRDLNQPGCQIWLQWVPGHVGLEPNELSDSRAKAAALKSRDAHDIGVPHISKSAAVMFHDARSKVALWGS